MQANNQTTYKGVGGLNKTISIIVQETNNAIPFMKEFAQDFKSNNILETSRKIWDYIKDNIEYVRDTLGKEEIRTPQRTLSDQRGDCEDYSIFAASILVNLGYQPVFYVVAMDAGYQHIYVVVDGIVIDGVMDTFNEHPPKITKYIVVSLDNKKQYRTGQPMNNYSLIASSLSGIEGMPIYVLSGIDDATTTILKDIKPFIAGTSDGLVLVDADTVEDIENYIDGFELLQGLGNLEGFGAIRDVFKKKTAQKTKKQTTKKSKKVTDFVKKTGLAPARAPFLLILKANVFHLASKLYIGYISEQEALKFGFSKENYDKLVKVRKNFETKWNKAGGDVSKLKNAVIKGRAIKWIEKKTGVQGIGDPATGTAIGTAITLSSAFWVPLLKDFNGTKAFDQLAKSDAGKKVAKAAKKAIDIAKDKLTKKDKNTDVVDNYDDDDTNSLPKNTTKSKSNLWLWLILGIGSLGLAYSLSENS